MYEYTHIHNVHTLGCANIPFCIVLHFFFDMCTIQSISFTIRALDLDDHYSVLIDTISQTIDFHGNSTQQTINEYGKNDIGLFNFTYSVQYKDNKCIDMETPADFDTDHRVTMSPDDNTSSIPACNNTTTQEVQESSLSPWLWIALAILFMILTLLLFIVSIVLIFIIRNKTLGMKEIQAQSTCEVNGKKNV